MKKRCKRYNNKTFSGIQGLLNAYSIINLSKGILQLKVVQNKTAIKMAISFPVVYSNLALRYNG